MQTSILWEGSLPSKEEMKCYNKVVTEVANKI